MLLDQEFWGQSAAHTGTQPSQNTEFKMNTPQYWSQACYILFKQHRYWDSEDAMVMCAKQIHRMETGRREAENINWCRAGNLYS